jgi:hypothetical protein
MPRVTGRLNPFQRGIRRIQFLAASLVPGATDTEALVLVGIIKRILSKRGTGRTYGSHTASAPGEPPAVRYGDLRRSIGREKVGGTIRVGSGLKRAAALEFGHRYSSGRILAPRPFMRPAVEQLKRFGPGNTMVQDLRRKGRVMMRFMP